MWRSETCVILRGKCWGPHWNNQDFSLSVGMSVSLYEFRVCNSGFVLNLHWATLSTIFGFCVSNDSAEFLNITRENCLVIRVKFSSDCANFCLFVQSFQLLVNNLYYLTINCIHRAKNLWFLCLTVLQILSSLLSTHFIVKFKKITFSKSIKVITPLH